MRRELLLAEACRSAWAVDPVYGERMMGVLTRWASGRAADGLDLQEAKATRDERAARQRTASAMGGGIAVFPLYGVIVPKAGLVTEYSGGTSCQAFSSWLREALADPSVGQILIDIDSPGGSVAGVQELASEIMQARTQKPVIGIANHFAASAAYWLGSCCTELYVSPSGEVGSIGVYVSHTDVSVAMEKAGVKETYISAGKFKVDGNSAEPLSPTARDHIQLQVNEFYRAFTTAVARGRGVSVERVRNGFGQGRLLLAEAAKAEGMVDGILAFSDLVRDMQAKPRSTRNSRPGARALLANSTSFPQPQRAAAQRRREIDLLELGS